MASTVCTSPSPSPLVCKTDLFVPPDRQVDFPVRPSSHLLPEVPAHPHLCRSTSSASGPVRPYLFAPEAR